MCLGKRGSEHRRELATDWQRNPSHGVGATDSADCRSDLTCTDGLSSTMPTRPMTFAT